MKRIHWNHDTKVAIAELSFSFVKKGMDDLAAVRKAMAQLLPSDLHRNIYAISVVSPWLFPMWEELRKDGQFAEQRVDPVDVPASQPEVTPALALKDATMAEIMGEMVARFERMMDPAVWEERIRIQVNECLDRRLPGILPKDPLDAQPKPEPVTVSPVTTKATAQTRKSRVLVIGLLPAQQRKLNERFPNVVFTHIGGDASENRVRSLAANMDLTVKTHWSNGMDLRKIPRVLNVQGSMSSIIRELEKFEASRS